MNGPGANLFFAGGEIGAEAEQMISGTDQRADARFVHAEFLKEFLRLPGRKIDEVAFDLRADDDRFTGQVRLHVFADLGNKRVLIGSGKVGFLDVACKNRRLVGEEIELPVDQASADAIATMLKEYKKVRIHATGHLSSVPLVLNVKLKVKATLTARIL